MSLESGTTLCRLNHELLPEPGRPMASTTRPFGGRPRSRRNHCGSRLRQRFRWCFRAFPADIRTFIRNLGGPRIGNIVFRCSRSECLRNSLFAASSPTTASAAATTSSRSLSGTSGRGTRRFCRLGRRFCFASRFFRFALLLGRHGGRRFIRFRRRRVCGIKVSRLQRRWSRLLFLLRGLLLATL